MMSNEKLKILISGGGTGGHIFPAIAIANGIKEQYPDAEILFVGAKGRMEMEKVPKAGYPIKGLWISGFQRNLSATNLLFPFKVISSLWRASSIIRQFKPHIAIGTGGYASGPLLYQASKKGIPTLILEQNSYPGITNKILGKKVDTICVAYQGMEKYFPKEKIVVTGSPIRKEILHITVNKQESLSYFGLKPDLPVLLIIGGSQGARGINQAVLKNMEKITATGVQILWQTGSSSYQEVSEKVQASPMADKIIITEFISRMDMAYTASDVIISRAGAIAIAEIVSVGKPAIFIPLPSAAEDHQTKNAKTLSEQGAALLLPEKEAENRITETVTNLIHNPKKQERIVKNLQAFKTEDATSKIVEQIKKLIKQK
jgi:UDP-N-acetylglucosamine--N-acetylmuramyl-(pentapeptide) pyrophosphoryl-undecaprenol N-acetylglucosamine transferase